MVFDAGVKPLATIAWAESEDEAKAVQSFKQEYIQCLNCSHVWNHLFDWEQVPYGNKPNKMYNNGSQWKKHIKYLQDWLSERIPLNPKVKIGKLSNGLTYYIQANKKPLQRAEMRLVVKAGSILEDEDQQGLAHIVEHMAFNGTTNFKSGELVDFFESIALIFSLQYSHGNVIPPMVRFSRPGM